MYRIDPSTNKAHVVRRTDGPATVAVGGGAAWVSAAGPPSRRHGSADLGLQQGASGGEANPRFLIVSDFPLKGSDNRLHPPDGGGDPARPRAAWLPGRRVHDRLPVLRRLDRPGRVGGHRFAATANAKAYARNPDVIGIVGSYNSGCSGQEIPVANQAPNGPLAMISPASTVTDPHAAGTGCRVPRKTSEHLYPTGERNFVRTAAAGHLTATAMAQFAKQKGVKRLFLSWERQPLLCRIRRRRGKRSKVPGNPDRRRRSVRPGGARLRSIRSTDRSDPRRRGRAGGIRVSQHPRAAARSPRRPRSSCDADRERGLPSPNFLHVAGPAALGMYFAYPGADISFLPPAGKRFLNELKARTGKPSRVLHRLRRPVSRDPARRDRPLRRHPRLSDQGTVQNESRERHPRQHPLRQERRPCRSTRHHLAYRPPLARTARPSRDRVILGRAALLP